VAGLGADIAGVSAAIMLARRLRGVADHAASPTVLRDLDVMRRSGWIVTTPPEARARADLVILAGPGIDSGRPELALVLDGQPRFLDGVDRTVLRLCPDGDADALIAQLGLLRMSLSGRRAELPPALAEIAGALHHARYAVIAWSAAAITEAAVDMLCGLVETLNAKSRAAGLPLSAGGNAMGASQACSWLTGYPLPVGFGRGTAEHDPWRFDSVRLADSGESDAALWIAALDPSPPQWSRAIDMIALVPEQAASETWVKKAKVAIAVAQPSGVLYDARLAALASQKAPEPDGAPTVADVISAIEKALPSC
jgi:formylmethanofuran dehydrogenase subunit B